MKCVEKRQDTSSGRRIASARSFLLAGYVLHERESINGAEADTSDREVPRHMLSIMSFLPWRGPYLPSYTSLVLLRPIQYRKHG